MEVFAPDFLGFTETLENRSALDSSGSLLNSVSMFFSTSTKKHLTKGARDYFLDNLHILACQGKKVKGFELFEH